MTLATLGRDSRPLASATDFTTSKISPALTSFPSEKAWKSAVAVSISLAKSRW